MRKFFFSLVFIWGVFLCPIAKASTNVSGTITEDTTWDLAGSPYIMVGNVTVNSGVTLTILLGVEVRSGGNYSLSLYGHLEASGVTFVGEADWLRVYVTVNNGGDADLTNCAFSGYNYVTYNSGSSGTIDNCDGSWHLTISSASVAVLNGCTISDISISASTK